jgi:hypothetical protein
MPDAGYIHPASGREYYEGDPAHRLARLTHALAGQCERFLDEYRRQLADTDYLDQYRTWPGDCDQVARTMARTIELIDTTYSDVTSDRLLHEYGLGKKDAEWERKYGTVERKDPHA